MHTSARRIFVTFIVREAEIYGRVTGGLLRNEPAKIAFIDGYNPKQPRRYNGFLPVSGEEWLCELVHDSRPGMRAGAYFVAPMRPSRWEWREVGEPVLGERERRPTCVDDPGRPEEEAPFSEEERRRQNAAYAQKVAQARAAEAPFASQQNFWALAATLGCPTSWDLQGRQIVFRYDSGATASTTPAELLALGWSCRSCDGWNRSGNLFVAHLTLSWPPVQFTEVAATLDGNDLVRKEPGWSCLGPRIQQVLLKQVRANHSPEQAARRDLEALLDASPETYRDAVRDFLNLRRPGSISLTPAPGKPGWSQLRVGRTSGESISCGEVQGTWNDPEECRRHLLAARRDQFLRDLRGSPGSSPNFYDEAEWVSRYTTERDLLANRDLRRAEVEVSTALAKLRSAEEKYEAACDARTRLQLDIEAFWDRARRLEVTSWDLPTEVKIPKPRQTAEEIYEDLSGPRAWLQAAQAQLATLQDRGPGRKKTTAHSVDDLRQKFNRSR